MNDLQQAWNEYVTRYGQVSSDRPSVTRSGWTAEDLDRRCTEVHEANQNLEGTK